MLPIPISNHISTNITVIAFRRPMLLHTTLQMLKINHGIAGTPLYIYIDGARKQVKDEAKMVEETVQVAKRFEWDGEKKIFSSEHNRGLHDNVRFAINTSLVEYESTIIVEDDIVTSPFFFRYAIQGLNIFANNYEVAAICAHCYPYSRKKFNPDKPYFLKHFACWGWATWRRSWEKVCWDTGVLREELKKVKGHREINFGAGEFVSGILDAHHNGYINTWDVQTAVSFFLNEQYCLFPPETLTNNTGWRLTDHSTHVFAKINFNAPLAYTEFIIDNTMPIEVSLQAWKAYQAWLSPPIRKKIKTLIKKAISIVAPFLRPIKRIIMKKNDLKSNRQKNQ